MTIQEISSSIEGIPAMTRDTTSSPKQLALGPDLKRLAWSNLLAQSGEQIALAAAPIVAVVMLGSPLPRLAQQPRSELEREAA
jgi:hypothetical protein